MIYLDNAATTLQKPAGVSAAVLRTLENCTSVGRGGYSNAFEAAKCVYTARERAMNLFGAENAEQIVFTHNATHSLNLAIKGAFASGHCVISGYEHNSVLRPVSALTQGGFSYSVARGRLFDSEDMLRKFRNALKRNTRLAVVTHMSNVFGYILPIKEIDEMCYRKGIPLIVDASQAAGCIDVKLSDFKSVICICAPGHKGLYGPQGTGILVCRNGEKLATVLEGGTGSVSASLEQPSFMPDRLECGTHNVPGIAGLSEGIAYVLERGCRNIFLKEYGFIECIATELAGMRGVTVFSTREKGIQGGVLSFICDGIGSEYIAEKLAEKQIAVRGGLQCAPLAHETVGTVNGTVRVSVSDFTTENDVEEALRGIYSVLREWRAK